MADTLDISLDDGKKRYGVQSRDNLVLMFTYEIESLRARLAEANEREANARCVL